MGRGAKPAAPKTAHRFVALLRGINVGGNNLIKMAELKVCLEEAGFTGVATYIQSGNIVLASSGGTARKVGEAVEAAITARFGHTVWALILSHEEMRQVVADAPKGFGAKPAEYRSDVVFLRPPLVADAVLPGIAVKPGVDEVSAGRHALYFQRVLVLAGKSYLSKIVQSPIYRDVTIRNWATTTKLLALADGG